MDKQKTGYVELTRIIMAKSMDIPPDDIDMFAIFKCVQRAIEEKVENSSEEYTLAPSSEKEIKAVIGEIGETVIPMMFACEYPFGDFVKNYGEWYEENLVAEFLKMKMQSFLSDREN